MNFQKNHEFFLIVLIFFLIRIPFLFFQTYWYLEDSLVQGLDQGYSLYCDFHKFEETGRWQFHVFPPGTYIYILIRAYLLENLLNFIADFFNLLFLYKIIDFCFDKTATFRGIVFYSFFPLAIWANGLINDPMIVTLPFILGGIYFFLVDRYVLSSFFLAIGTLILYIPAIIIVPIFFYCKNKKELLSFVKYLLIFIGVIFLGILPFLLSCPYVFIKYISISLNSPHSANLLHRTNFLYTTIIVILGFEIKAINFFQVIILIFTFLQLNDKLNYSDKVDVILSTIILFCIIALVTFYIHPRFFFWIFALSIIFFSNKKDNLLEKQSIIRDLIIFGIIYLAISIPFVIYFLMFIGDTNSYFPAVLTPIFLLFLILYLISFFILGFVLLDDKDNKILIIYSSISSIGFILYFLMDNVLFDIYQNISTIICILFFYLAMIYYIYNPLYDVFLQQKIT